MSSLSHLSDVAEQKENTPDVRTPILKIKPEDGTKLVFKNRLPVGSAPGLALYADLQSSSGQLPVDTEVVLEAKEAGDNEFSTVSEVVGDISSYNNQSIQDQRSDDNVDSVKVELDGREVHVRDIDTFRVSIDSSEVIDWSSSSLYFDRRGVEEKQKGE